MNLNFKIVKTCGLCLIFIVCSCKTSQGRFTYDSLCKGFLLSLYEKKYDSLLIGMDDAVTKSISREDIINGLDKLSNKIRNDFEPPIKITFITSEKTIYEDFPTTFSIFKLESKSKFGYYFFYVNDKSKKILRVSEFNDVKPKQ